MAETKRGKVAVVSSSKFGKNSSEVIKTKDGGEKDTDGTLVTAGYGVTLSKNYQSTKVEVGVTFPTTRGGVKQAFKDAWYICEEEMSEQLEDAKEFLKQIG